MPFGDEALGTILTQHRFQKETCHTPHSSCFATWLLSPFVWKGVGFLGDWFSQGASHFCLVPMGTSSWTNHLYESFFAGCIPVILSLLACGIEAGRRRDLAATSNQLHRMSIASQFRVSQRSIDCQSSIGIASGRFSLATGMSFGVLGGAGSSGQSKQGAFCHSR